MHGFSGLARLKAGKQGAMKSITELQAPKSLSRLEILALVRRGKKDAPNYVNKSPDAHTYTSKAFEARCQQGQELVIQWLIEVNVGLTSERKTVVSRIAAREKDLAEAYGKLSSAENEREAAQKQASIYSYKAKIAEAKARLDYLVEAIGSNLDLAKSAHETWEQYYNGQTSVYLQALNSHIRKTDKSVSSSTPTQVVLPPFRNVSLTYSTQLEEPNLKRTGDMPEEIN